MTKKMDDLRFTVDSINIKKERNDPCFFIIIKIEKFVSISKSV